MIFILILIFYVDDEMFLYLFINELLVLINVVVVDVDIIIACSCCYIAEKLIFFFSCGIIDECCYSCDASSRISDSIATATESCETAWDV